MILEILANIKNYGLINIIILILKGIGIGVANIIPGVSGGTMAVVFGVYDKLTEAIGNFLGAPKNKKIEYGIFCSILGFGMALGILIFSHIIKLALFYYPRGTVFIFVLLIIPSIPIIIKNEKWSVKNILFFILGVVLPCIIMMITSNNDNTSNTDLTLFYAMKLFICGAIAAGAMIIPGISGSMLLLIIGEYYNVLSFINQFKIFHLLLFGFGVILGLIGISKIINYFLCNFRSQTLFFITGLIVVSIFQIIIKVI